MLNVMSIMNNILKLKSKSILIMSLFNTKTEKIFSCYSNKISLFYFEILQTSLCWKSILKL